MEPADLRNGDDPAPWWGFDDSGPGTVVVERLVRSCGVVVGEIGVQDVAKMGLAQNEEIQALAAKGADDPFGEVIGRGQATPRVESGESFSGPTLSPTAP